MRLNLNLLALVALAALHTPLAAQETISSANGDAGVDRETVLRLDPQQGEQKLLPVPRKEIKPGFTYNYFHPTLNRRVWGLAREDGSLEYAFGEGTIVPTRQFDLRMSEAAQEKLMEARAPRLKQALEGLGRSPAAQLNAAGEWELLSYASSARVFDLATSQRWEWHGPRRLAVLHTGGNLWEIIDGRYQPLTIGYAFCH